MIGNLNVISQLSGGNVLGRWNHTFSSRSDTTFQFYFDNYERTGPESRETRNTIDFDFSHHLGWGSRQDVIWGAGYRRTWDQDLGTIDQAFQSRPIRRSISSHFFAQDTIALLPDRLFLTAGTKVENSYFTGYGVEPSVRLAWTPSKWMTFWSAVSRAERTPDQQGYGPRRSRSRRFPIPWDRARPWKSSCSATRNFSPSTSWPTKPASARSPTRGFPSMSRLFSIATTIWKLWSQEQEVFEPALLPPALSCPSRLANLMYGTTEGGEISANLKLTDRWTLSPGYAFLEMHLHTKPSSQDTTSVAEFEGSSPQHQAQLRSHVDLSHGLSWDANAYFVSALAGSGRRVLHARRYAIEMEICGTRGFQRGGAEPAAGPSPGIAGCLDAREFLADQAQRLREIHLAFLVEQTSRLEYSVFGDW